MASLKAQFDALKQQHQFTVMQLTDLKEDYQKIKKLNTTILQNMMKQSPDTLNQIRLIIDGNFYNQKIIDLEAQLDLLKKNLNDQIQRRVQQYLKNIKQSQHDCQNCQKCIKLLTQCSNCKRLIEKIKKLQKVLEQKNEGIDRLRLQIQQKRSQYQILQTRKNNQKSQLQQINKILKANIKDLQEIIKQNQAKYRNFNQQWENQYNNLNQQYQTALAQLDQYKMYIQQQQQQQNRQSMQSSKKNHMMKEIQNILGQLGGNRKSTINNGINTNPPRILKYNSSSSRMIQDPDLCNFSIKDAINRPNQFTYY